MPKSKPRSPVVNSFHQETLPFPIAKMRMELEPHLATHEMGWRRTRPRQLLPNASLRNRDSVSWSRGYPSVKDRSSIHTHIWVPANAKRFTRALPSMVDLFHIMTEINSTSIRFWHVVSVNRVGQVIGYYSLHAGDRLVKAVRNRSPAEKVVEGGISAYRYWGPGKKGHTAATLEIIRKLQELGLIVHTKPMPGYQFVKDRFIPLKKKK